MANETLKLGDVVKLRSGGPAMTVRNVDEDYCTVCFFDPITNLLTESIRFPIAVLKPYQEDQIAF